MSSVPSVIYQHLEPRKDSNYKALFVKGTRIRARVLYGLFASTEDPWSPEFIAEQYDLPLQAVKEAIAYCQADPPELKEDYAREEALMEAMGMNGPEYKKTGMTKVLTGQELGRLIRE